MLKNMKKMNKKTSIALLALLSATSLSFTPMHHTHASRIHRNHITRRMRRSKHGFKRNKRHQQKRLSHNQLVRLQYFRNHKHSKFHYNPRVPVVKNNTLSRHQNKQQKKVNIHRVNQLSRIKHQSTSWFRDGLSHRNLSARQWIARHESGYEWYVENWTGSGCIGYFQLSPSLLGRRHGRLNLNRKHQVRVADAYARARYGSWINAKRFWQAHHWY